VFPFSRTRSERDINTNKIVDKWEGELTEKSPAWTRAFPSASAQPDDAGKEKC
jgi:hypothetical protein